MSDTGSVWSLVTTESDFFPQDDWVQVPAMAGDDENVQNNAPQMGTTASQAPLAATPSTGNILEKAPSAPVQIPSSLPSTRLPSRKYDTTTLLNLRNNAVPAYGRVAFDAIAKDISQYTGTAGSSRYPNRLPVLTNISNISRGSLQSNSKVFSSSDLSNVPAEPTPYSIAPQQSSLLQRHDGVARFLQEHASPPHVRVTAGGRIVPTGPASPPPMFDFNSLNALAKERPTNAPSSQKDGRFNAPGFRAQGAKGQMPLSAPLAGYGSMNPMGTALPYNTAYYPQPVMGTSMPLTPVGMLADGSTIVSCNGLNYRSYWNGTGMVIEPLEQLHAPTDQQNDGSYYSAMSYGVSGNGLNYQFAQNSAPSVVYPSGAPTLPSYNPSGNVSENRMLTEAELSSHLSKLDKYLALNHYVITAAQRASCVSHRRYLVEELDKIRISKGKPSHSIPIIAPVSAAASASRALLHSDIQGDPVTPEAKASTMSQIAQAKGSSSSKSLSAAAPPFIPGQGQGSSSISYGSHLSSMQTEHHKPWGSNGPYDTDPPHINIKGIVEVAKSRKEKSKKAHDPASHRDLSSSSVLDPTDPAMRVIDAQDVAYAEAYTSHPPGGVKEFCTTIAEFQEAIRRVREQARMYGCAGGQSRDPAYDAEQDLWYAICDHDPIPLPTKVPDHVAYPRSWNWNDSAFNYRRLCLPHPRVVAETNTRTNVSPFWEVSDRLVPHPPSREGYTYPYTGMKVDAEQDKAFPVSDEVSKQKPPIRKAGKSHSENLKTAIAYDGPNESEIFSRPLHLDSQTRPIRTSPSKFVQRSNADANAFPYPSGRPDNRFKLSKKDYAGEINAMVLSLNENNDPTKQSRVSSQLSGKEDNINHGTMTRLPKLTFNWPQNDPIEAQLRAKENHGQIQSMLQPIAEDSPETLDSNRRHLKQEPPSASKTDTSGDYEPDEDGPSKVLGSDLSCLVAVPDPNDPWSGELSKSLFNQISNCQNTTKISDEKCKYPNGISAETASQWGPENEDTLGASSDRLDLPSLCKTAWVPVKIPSSVNTQTLGSQDNVNSKIACPSPMHAHCASDVQASKSSAENKDSPGFLRKMFKSPPFSLIPTFGLKQMKPMTAENEKYTLNTTTKGSSVLTKEGGMRSPQLHDRQARITANELLLNSLRPLSINASLATGKAQSSLASSNYHAQGQLPQFLGVEKARAAALHRDDGDQPPHPEVRVRLPLCTSSEERKSRNLRAHQRPKSAYKRFDPYHVPAISGYDGGDDPRSEAANATSVQAQASFDYNGVTEADFNINRGDVDNEWHRGAVRDFFRDLREKEEAEILSVRQAQRDRMMLLAQTAKQAEKSAHLPNTPKKVSWTPSVTSGTGKSSAPQSSHFKGKASPSKSSKLQSSNLIEP